MRALLIAALAALALTARAQQYTGIEGLIHTPSAEMDTAGTARVGTHYMHRDFTPASPFSYNTWNYYISFSPFSWVSAAYTCTLQKEGNRLSVHQDRFFSIKLRPLAEGKWWPAVALGTNDPMSDGKSLYFSNFYVAATKHFYTRGHELAAHVAGRYFRRDYNSKWNGVTAAVTYRPAFYRDVRLIAEWTGNEVNIGADCLLWKYLLLQGSLKNGRYPSAGVACKVDLLKSRKKK